MSISQQQQPTSNAGINKSMENTQQTILIRKIQMLRGQEPCFATEKSHDCAEICQWRRDCRKPRAAWQR